MKLEQEPEPECVAAAALLPEAGTESELDAPSDSETIGVEEVDQAGLRSVTRQRRKAVRKAVRKFALTASILSFVLGIPAGLLAWQLFPGQWVTTMIVSAILTCAGLIGIPISLMLIYYGNAHSSAKDPMPTATGIDAIGPLLDRMETDIANVGAIRFALTAPLLEITPEDTAVLETRHYRQLNVYLNRAAWEFNSVRLQERDYLLAVLHAYACVGDPRAIRNVERIAIGKANSGMRDDEIRAAAVRCLEHLNVAKEQLSHHTTLLRSSQISYPEGELMRPARSTSSSDPEQLMRPTADSMTEPKD